MYIFSLEIALIISLLYLHIVIILIYCVTEVQKEKIIQIVEYIKNRDDLTKIPDDVDLLEIYTGKDVINVIEKMNTKK